MRVVRDQQHRTYVGGKKGGGRNKGGKCVTCLIYKLRAVRDQQHRAYVEGGKGREEMKGENV